MAGTPTTSAKSWRPGQPVVLESARAIIRSMTADDVNDRYVGWFADPEIMRQVTMDMNPGQDELIAFLQSFDNIERFHFGIFLKESDRLIGWQKILCDPVKQNGMITLVIGDPDYRGKGFGFEIRAATLDFMFGDLDLHKSVSLAYGDNPSSHALSLKLGCQLEGILRQEEIDRDGQWRDVHVYGLLADEWRQRKR